MATLSIGSKGASVKNLQIALANLSLYESVVDGHYGPDTQAAVAAFQKANNLVMDGIAGERTQTALALLRGKSEIPAWALTDADIVAAAKRLQVKYAAVRAVAEVESKGYGFHSEGKPKILFERHHMYKKLVELQGEAAANKAMAERPDLVNTERGGYRGGLHEWTRFEAACKYDRAAAIQACSWGRYQIMGFHYLTLGFKTAEDFMRAMCTTEKEHLNAFVSFIRADKNLLQALKNLTWDVFARIYNGPAYKENEYDVKLATAFQKYVDL